MAKRKRNEYVNNKDFLAALIKYRDEGKNWSSI